MSEWWAVQCRELSRCWLGLAWPLVPGRQAASHNNKVWDAETTRQNTTQVRTISSHLAWLGREGFRITLYTLAQRESGTGSLACGRSPSWNILDLQTFQFSTFHFYLDENISHFISSKQFNTDTLLAAWSVRDIKACDVIHTHPNHRWLGFNV